MYREDVINAYKEALRLYGVSEESIIKYTLAFQTGYDAGVLANEDSNTKEKMISLLQYEEKLN
jgi:hypothetical protein